MLSQCLRIGSAEHVPSSPPRSSDPAILDTARAALALVGITGYGTGRYEPGIDPHTQDPLTVEEAPVVARHERGVDLDQLVQDADAACADLPATPSEPLEHDKGSGSRRDRSR